MPYTTHGHWYGPGEPTQPGPRFIAKCFGLGGCEACRTEAGLPPRPEPEPTPKRTTVYASIGNSDDKLSQREWYRFANRFMLLVKNHAAAVHGEWYSDPLSPWQNACVGFEIGDEAAVSLRACLTEVAAQFGQDSIAWAVADTTFITPGEAKP